MHCSLSRHAVAAHAAHTGHEVIGGLVLVIAVDSLGPVDGDVLVLVLDLVNTRPPLTLLLVLLGDGED